MVEKVLPLTYNVSYLIMNKKLLVPIIIAVLLFAGCTRSPIEIPAPSPPETPSVTENPSPTPSPIKPEPSPSPSATDHTEITDVADLSYSTVYYWKVQALAASGAPAGDPVISIFTTMEEPAAPTPPVQVTIPPAPPTPEITIEIPKAVTPPYVWAIIGIGAVLVIALVVLIARTRRVV